MAGVDGRVIIVTGAAGGLGRAYAHSLAAHGARVVVNDLGCARDGSGSDKAAAGKVAAEIEEAGGAAVASHDDVATPEGAQALAETALSAFGAVHGVVSNAGILRDASYHKMDDADWDAVLRVHLYGGYYVTHAIWPYLREQGFGRIVVVTSHTGLFGRFGQASYGAAKLGLVGLVNTLAIEGARHGITANAVAPIAATRMTTDVAPADYLEKIPPGYVAPVVTHLLSDECADTASALIVGGGLVQRVRLYQNAGVTFAEPPSVAEVAARWSEITGMSQAVPAVNILA